MDVAELLDLWPDTELLEYVCNENEKDRKHSWASSPAWRKR